MRAVRKREARRGLGRATDCGAEWMMGGWEDGRMSSSSICGGEAERRLIRVL